MDKSTDRIWDRLGAVSGILGIVLERAGFALMVSGSGLVTLDLSASKEEVAKGIAVATAWQAFTGMSLEVLGSVLLIVFAARLWATLRHAEGDPGWISATAFGAMLVAIATGVAAQAAEQAMALRAGHGLNAQEAMALIDLSATFFTLGPALIALFLAATAVVVLRMRALPLWLGWSAAVIAVALLMGVAAPNALGGGTTEIAFILVSLWFLAVSVVLLRRPFGYRVVERVAVPARPA